MIVVDASIILKWLVAEADSAKASSLVSQPMSAPAIWMAEVGNVLWRYVRVGQFSESEARFRLSRALASSLTTISIEHDLDNALSLAASVDHPIYDCLYLALAIREQTCVVTADTRFAKAVRKHKQWNANIKLLSET